MCLGCVSGVCVCVCLWAERAISQGVYCCFSCVGDVEHIPKQSSTCKQPLYRCSSQIPHMCKSPQLLRSACRAPSIPWPRLRSVLYKSLGKTFQGRQIPYSFSSAHIRPKTADAAARPSMADAAARPSMADAAARPSSADARFPPQLILFAQLD